MNGQETKINKGYGWAILFFVLLVFVLPFYESHRAISWSSPRGENSLNVFHRWVLGYSQQAEQLKTWLGWNDFFQRDQLFWLGLKSSPVLFQEQVVGFSASLATIKPVRDQTKNAPLPQGPVGVSEFIASSTLDLRGGTSEETSEDSLANHSLATTTNLLVFDVLKPPYNFLVLGDSFVAVYGGVGDILEGTLLRFQDVAVTRIGKVSSGLARPDYFNWENQARESIANLRPNVAIVMLGTNDSQSFQTVTAQSGLVIYKYGTTAWETEYRHRVDSFLRIFQDNNILVYWVGLPIMRDPGYSARVVKINSIYQEETAKFSNVVFVDTRNVLADANGAYAASLPDSRGIAQATHVADGIHLTNFGGVRVVNELFRALQTRLLLIPKN